MITYWDRKQPWAELLRAFGMPNDGIVRMNDKVMNDKIIVNEQRMLDQHELDRRVKQLLQAGACDIYTVNQVLSKPALPVSPVAPPSEVHVRTGQGPARSTFDH